MNIENMNLREAIEILEEVMELDDSIYAYNRKYRMALEFVIDCIKRDMAESEASKEEARPKKKESDSSSWDNVTSDPFAGEGW